MECSNIYSIVDDLEKKKAAKSSKQAKRGDNVAPTPPTTKGLESSNNEEFFCEQIRTWHTNLAPKYETQRISSVSSNETGFLYPVAIKLDTMIPSNFDAGSNETTIIIGFSQSGGNLVSRDRVNIVDIFHKQTRVLRSLRLLQSYTFINWKGKRRELSVLVKSIESNPNNNNRHAVIELTYDKALPNDSMSNLIICGYQGWFAFKGDGAAINKWKHWFSHPNDPKINDLTVEMYPTMDEYDDEDLIESNILMRDGSKAKFYSAFRPKVVLKHFEWMREYGISGVFHMRFMQDIDKPRNYQWKTQVLRNVRAAAEATGRIFAVSYNIAGNNINESVLDEIKNDWIKLVDDEEISSSDRYLHHNRLPVLRIYGIGFKSVSCIVTILMAFTYHLIHTSICLK